MMTAIVSKLWIMSLQASILILIVLAARVFLRKYPKGYRYFLAERKAYANVLLTFAEKRDSLWMKLAFGEPHTEQRVKNILYRKKKSNACILIAAFVMLLSGCSFLEESSNTVILSNEENRIEKENVQNQDAVLGDEISETDSGEEIPESNSSDALTNKEENIPESDSSDALTNKEENIPESDSSDALTNKEENIPETEVSIEDNSAYETEMMVQIEEVISEAEEKAAEWNQELQNASSQTDMNVVSGEIYKTWDTALNSIWSILNENMDEKSREWLLAEQLEWIAEKEAAIQAAGEEYGGGSLAILVSNDKAAELTRERVYELAEYLQPR